LIWGSSFTPCNPLALFDSFDPFNFVDLDISGARRFSHENSAPYGTAGLACALPESRVGEAMFKVSVIDNAKRRRLIVEGKLIAPWTAELRSASEKARADLRDRELIIEMKHITTISQEGENVILELINKGVRFRCDGVFAKHVVKELTRRARRNVGEAER
jgi:hypothetical protein